MTNEEIFLTGDIELLYNSNVKFMHYLCKKYNNTSIEYDDLFGLCELAFMKAYNAYDPNSGTKWTTYYSMVASNEIGMQLRKHKKLDAMEHLSEPITRDKDGHERTLEDIIGSSINIEEDFEHEDDLRRLREAIESLPDRDRRIIELKLQGKSQIEIGDMLGFTQSYISRITLRAIKRLKRLMETGGEAMKKKGKTYKSSKPFMPPTRYPVGTPAKMVEIEKEIDRRIDAQVTEQSNTTLNLTISAFMIVLKELYEFEADKLKDVLDKVFEQLELCGQEIVTIDQMMDLCKDYGLDVSASPDKMKEIGEQMNKKTKVFEALDNGTTETEDLVKKCGVTSHEASAIRWQYNKIKYGKDYEGDEVMASKKAMAFEMFDKGAVNNITVAKAIGVSVASVATYRYEWKKNILSQSTSEEAADYFAGKGNIYELAKKLKEKKANENVEKVPESVEEVQNSGDTKEEANNKVSECGPISVESKGTQEPVSKGGLRRTISLLGEFTKYTLAGKEDFVNVEMFGQVITVAREEMRTLVKEFSQVVEDDFIWGGDR